jgi:hypothetical protein
MSTANDRQVAGSHYRASLQHWDYVVGALENRYLEGQLTKYVFRWRKKNGLQDLDKSLHYAQKLYEEALDGRVSPPSWPLRGNITQQHFLAQDFKALDDFTKFNVRACCAANDLGAAETEIAIRCVIWRTPNDVKEIMGLISSLIWRASEETALDQASHAGGGYVNQD